MNKLPAGPGARPRWKVVGAGVALIVALLLLVPQLPLLRATPLPVLLAGTLCNWLARRRWLDAVLFAATLVAAELWTEPLAGPQVFTVACLLMLALTGRPRLALWVGVLLLALLLGSVDLKQSFAGSPLTWQDLRYFFLKFEDNIGVMASQPTLLMKAGLASLAAAFCTWIVWRLDRPVRGSVIAEGRRGVPWSVRLLALLAAFGAAHELDVAARRQSQQPAWSFSEPKTSTPISTFLSTLHLEPKAQFEHLATQGFEREVAALRAAAQAARRPADIVVFLQESQFNPLAVAGCPPTLCDGPAFRGQGRTVDDGELRVHTYGGGTWLSEFSLVTGIPHTLYGNAGQYASFNVAPGVRRSLVRSLKDAGYHTVALHPVRGGMMNARSAYRSYGFDEFFDARDLGLPGTFNTADALVHEQTLKVLERARRRGKPVFVLALTIFNHGEHGVATHPVPEDFLRQTQAATGDAVEHRNLADYLWRTRAFEATYEKTEAALLGGATPAVLAWFGDHQPPFATAPRLRNSVRARAATPALPDRYVTWYNVSTNLGDAPGAARRHRLDLVFLPGLLAQRAGVPLDDWLAANVLARERCGGLLFECAEPGLRDTYFSYLLDRLQAVR